MKIYSSDDLSKILNRRPRTVRKLMREGVIPGKKIAGRWYVSEDSLKESFRVNKDRGNSSKGKKD